MKMRRYVITAADAALDILSQMSAADRAGYRRDDWAEGISMMLCDAWEHLALDEVLDAIDARIPSTINGGEEVE